MNKKLITFPLFLFLFLNCSAGDTSDSSFFLPSKTDQTNRTTFCGHDINDLQKKHDSDRMYGCFSTQVEGPFEKPRFGTQANNGNVNKKTAAEKWSNLLELSSFFKNLHFTPEQVALTGFKITFELENFKK